MAMYFRPMWVLAPPIYALGERAQERPINMQAVTLA